MESGKNHMLSFQKVLGNLQSCVPGAVVTTQTKLVFKEGEMVHGKKCLNVSFDHLVHALMGLHSAKPSWYMTLWDVY